MSKKVYPLDKKPEDTADLEKLDTYYSEELSRAAVGRLFDDDDEEEGDDGPPQIKSAFVTGFDRAPSRDKNPTKKRERPPAREEHDRFKPQEEEPQAEEPPIEEREEAPPERHRRRETATTRLLSSGSNNAREDDSERRERTGRRNPSPKPAVRVNVAKEREHDPNEPKPDDLETFRRRYNSEELFSPPRNPNRPVRKGRTDVRKDRIPINTGTEPVTPLNMILAGAAIVVVAIVCVLTFQLISHRSKLSDAEEKVTTLETQIERMESQHDIEVAELKNELVNAHIKNVELQVMLTEHGLNPDDPPPGSEGDRPGSGITPTPPPGTGSNFPVTHVVAPREVLSTIARRYYGNADPATLEHIRVTNNIRDINNIGIGLELTLTEMQ